MPRRDRIRRRSPVARWTGRILGLLGTAAVLAVGVVAGTMIASAADDEVVGSAPAATPTPAPEGKKRGKAAKPRLSRAPSALSSSSRSGGSLISSSPSCSQTNTLPPIFRHGCPNSLPVTTSGSACSSCATAS